MSCDKRVNIFSRLFKYVTVLLYPVKKNKKEIRKSIRGDGANVLRRVRSTNKQNEPRGANTEWRVSIRAVKSYFIGNESDYIIIREVCKRNGIEFTETYFRSTADCYGGINLTERKAR